jgi:hypothetical protein
VFSISTISSRCEFVSRSHHVISHTPEPALGSRGVGTSYRVACEYRLKFIYQPHKMARKALANDQIVKLIVGAGQASPSPPVGPALGSKGVKSMDFCKVHHYSRPSSKQPKLTRHPSGIQRSHSKLHRRHTSPCPRHRPP